MENSPNILFIILDSARAQNMSLYGYKRNTTPFLEEFANRSTLYTQARAPSIHSISSHVSMFTGKHVEEHRAIHHTAQIDISQTIWDEIGTKYDYTTSLFTNNKIISHASNLGKLFDYNYSPNYDSIRNQWPQALFKEAYYPGKEEGIPGFVGNAQRSLVDDAPLRSLLNCTYSQWLKIADRIEARFSELPSNVGYKKISGDVFVNAFLKWESEQDRPWAACLNLMDTHLPYTPKSEFDRWTDEKPDKQRFSIVELLSDGKWGQLEGLESLYDGTIAQVDSILEELIDELEKRGKLNETLVIITSDHGEGFGEASQIDPEVRLKDHSWGLHEVLTHVPLVIKYPEQTENQVVGEVVSLTDLPDTIRSVAQGSVENEILTTSDSVFSSTFRMLEEDAKKYSSVENIERLIGPWRAVYETNGNKVRKFANKGDEYLTLDVNGLGDSSMVSKDEHTKVETEYDRLTENTVLIEQTSTIDADLEEHLEDLGYIR